MVTTTTFPGLVSIDPIQGLIDYVADIKPYHTKVFETLVEYVYTDFVNVNIVDLAEWNIPIGQTDASDSTVNEDGGAQAINSSAQATIIVSGGQITSVVITTPGSEYTFGDDLTVIGLGPGSGLSLKPATLGVGNSLTTVTIVNPGSGYTDGTYNSVLLTYTPNGVLAIPTNFTEMFDFFITAPTPISHPISSSDVPNGIIYFSGDFTADFSIGDLIVIDNSPTDKFHLLTVGYDTGLNQTTVTLNTLTLAGTTATIYHTDTTSNWMKWNPITKLFDLSMFPIQSAVVGPISVTEPVTGTTFNNISTFTVQGNATRSMQPGSIIQAVVTLGQVAAPTVYRVAFVQFVAGFNVDGSRNPNSSTLDTSVIGVELDAVFTDAVIGAGFLIPYNITGYDGRYDGPYDRMAGYQIISG